jgi:hypothetical protein
MSKIRVCHRSEISDADWFAFWWSEVTSLEDSERVYLKGRAKTPAELAEAGTGWTRSASLAHDGAQVGDAPSLAITLGLVALVVSAAVIAFALRFSWL